jgi:hypothetical protein
MKDGLNLGNKFIKMGIPDTRLCSRLTSESFPFRANILRSNIPRFKCIAATV